MDFTSYLGGCFVGFLGCYFVHSILWSDDCDDEVSTTIIHEDHVSYLLGILLTARHRGIKSVCTNWEPPKIIKDNFDVANTSIFAHDEWEIKVKD